MAYNAAMIKAPTVQDTRWDPLVYMPPENSLEVFSHLGIKDLVQCRRVSMLWYRYASDNALWKKLFPEMEFPPNEMAIGFIDRRALTSKDQIVQSIQKFVSEVPLHQIGILTCHFPFSFGSIVEIRFGCGDVDPIKNSDLKAVCFFMKAFSDNHSQNGSKSRELSVVHSEIIPQKPKIEPSVRIISFYNSKFHLPVGEECADGEFQDRIEKVLNDRLQILEEEKRDIEKNQ